MGKYYEQERVLQKTVLCEIKNIRVPKNLDYCNNVCNKRMYKCTLELKPIFTGELMIYNDDIGIT